jgi:hypothetical protein
LKDGFVWEEQWDFFTYSWQQYKSVANMDGSVNDRLGACLGARKGDMVATKIFAKLGDELLKELAKVEMMQETKQLVVKTRNKLAHRLKIGVMAQGLDEMITSFEMRLKQVARLGGLQVQCATCKELVDYTDNMVMDNLIRGSLTRSS